MEVWSMVVEYNYLTHIFDITFLKTETIPDIQRKKKYQWMSFTL
jgi:hypothetical protein